MYVVHIACLCNFHKLHKQQHFSILVKCILQKSKVKHYESKKRNQNSLDLPAVCVIWFHPNSLQTEEACRHTAVFLCLMTQQMLLVEELLSAARVAAFMQRPRQY